MTGVNGPGQGTGDRKAEKEGPLGSYLIGPTGGDAERSMAEEIVAEELAEAADEETESGLTEIIDGDAPDLNAVARAMAERDEYLDSLRRLQAEFENYKKRVAKQQADQAARAELSLVEKLLPVLDTLDLAIEHMGDPGSVDGRALDAVYSQLRDVLTKEGLERISPIGEHFDPTAHEAVAHVPAEDPVDEGASAGEGARGGEGVPGEAEGGEAAPGDARPRHDGEPVVAEVMRAGYRWRGTVVRPAMVMVRG